MTELQREVATTSDAAGLHAPIPALLLELQAVLGELAARTTDVTARGRRPFRPTEDWAAQLGALGFGVYLLADASGVDLEAQVAAVASVYREATSALPDDNSWPVK